MRTIVGVSYQTAFHRAHIKVAGPTEEAALKLANNLGAHLMEVLPVCTLMPPKLQDDVDEYGRHVCLATVIIGADPGRAKAEIAKIALKDSF
jgi:hypothetical protein